jgi:tRNA (mo5U34)-methyltransferase
MHDRTLQSRITNPRTETEREIARLGPWFHNLHLPDGTQTAPDHPLGDFPLFKWRQIAPHLPQDLSQWQVLDIGCNAGFYSIHLAKRGAHVTGIDVNPHYLRQAEWARSQFGLDGQIELRQMQVYDLAREEKIYDLVLFMGVLYHLRYPLLALDIICRKASRLLAVQSLTLPGKGSVPPPADMRLAERRQMAAAGWPKMAFIEKRLEDDPTNWWVPNHACIEAMLRTSGMKVVARPGHEIYLCEPDPVLVRARKGLDAELRAATGQPRRKNSAG